jgi:hypothetical protein
MIIQILRYQKPFLIHSETFLRIISSFERYSIWGGADADNKVRIGNLASNPARPALGRRFDKTVKLSVDAIASQRVCECDDVVHVAIGIMTVTDEYVHWWLCHRGGSV